jgi:hypothetical protein
MTAATRLKILCDWINVHDGIESLGDIALDLAEAIFYPAVAVWAALMIRSRHEEPHA